MARAVAKCHPAKIHHAKGLCKACYFRPKMRDRYKRAGVPEATRSYKLKHKYGLTVAEYERLLIEQGGACKVCRRIGPGRRNVTTLYIDHNHNTHTVRGLLCHDCNSAEGYLHGDPGLARRLAEYLESNGP